MGSLREALEGSGFLSWAPSSSLKWGPFAETRRPWSGKAVERAQGSEAGEGARATDASAAWESRQVLNPEESQDEDDSVVVTDDSEQQPLGDAEVLASEGQGVGGHAVGGGEA